MHVLFIPKWYPGRKDPQLGDFLRKQAEAAAHRVRMSVLVVMAETDRNAPVEDEVSGTDDMWELRCYYRASEHAWATWRKVINLQRYWHAAMRGRRRVWRERGHPDLVHAYILVRPVLVAWWIKVRSGIPFLISEQSSEYLDGTFARKGALFAAWNRFLFRRSVGVTAVSAWLGDKLVELGLCKSFDVVPNVVPGLDRPLPPVGPSGHFMMVADLVDKTKNVSGVIRALHAARATDPRLHLTIIGDGVDRNMLEALASEHRLNGSVRFLGRLPNSSVLDHVAKAGAVVVNSRVETFSVVTGEALAQGKPVIATRCGGPVAFIDNTNGILVDVDDDAALSSAMLQLTANADRYDPAIIRAGLSDRFSPDAVGRKLAAIYERIAHDANR